jgi:sec-independent protein translocase protein TatB
MFDVGFSELVLIFIVGLLVLGPERLPVVIRTTSRYLARLRRSFNEVRAEIEREVGYDEIKRDLHNQSILDSLKQARDDLGKAGRELQDLPYDISGIIKEESTASKPGEPAPGNSESDPPADDRPRQ